MLVGFSALATLAAFDITPTVEIAPGVSMPRINMGTCCGSEASNAWPAWYAAGGRGVDTAYDYGKLVPGGKQAELGAAIVKSGAAREQIFITSKIPAGFGVLTGFCVGGAAKALAQVRADVKELGVPQLDLVLLHSPCLLESQNAAMWSGLEQALALNLTRAIGVSNYKKDELVALLKTAKVKPAVNQCHMSIGKSGANHDDVTIAYAQSVGITYEAYEAMNGCPFGSDELNKISAAHNASSARVCLRWVLQRGAVMAVGLGKNTSKMDAYAAENLDLYSFSLTDDEMDILNKM